LLLSISPKNKKYIIETDNYYIYIRYNKSNCNEYHAHLFAFV